MARFAQQLLGVSDKRDAPVRPDRDRDHLPREPEARKDRGGSEGNRPPPTIGQRNSATRLGALDREAPMAARVDQRGWTAAQRPGMST